MFFFFSPSVLLSKPKKQKQNEGDEKDEIKESNQMKMLNEIRRRLQLAEKGEWHPLLSNHMEDWRKLFSGVTQDVFAVTLESTRLVTVGESGIMSTAGNVIDFVFSLDGWSSDASHVLVLTVRIA